MKNTDEEVTRPDVFVLKQEIGVLRYQMDGMYERWLRTEHKYDCIFKAQNNINIKTNIVIASQMIILILLGVM
tara:strand:- start:81 stop:299 length:219 start_codon:yes stop_codon:yes gene_type:complete